MSRPLARNRRVQEGVELPHDLVRPQVFFRPERIIIPESLIAPNVKVIGFNMRGDDTTVKLNVTLEVEPTPNTIVVLEKE